MVKRYSRQKSVSGSKLPAATASPELGRAGLAGYCLLLTLAVAFLAIHPVSDGDFWHHIAFGRIIVDQGRFPRVDPFSFTEHGHYWVSSGWAPSILLYWLFKIVGSAGPIIFTALIAAATAILPVVAAWVWFRRVGILPLIVLVSIAMAYPRFNPRPDIMSQLMMPLLALVLLRIEMTGGHIPDNGTSSRLAWALPVIFLAWVNLHALFFLGLGMLALFMAWRWVSLPPIQRHQPAPWVPYLLCLPVTLINPYGWMIYRFIADNARLQDVGKRIYELKPLITAATFHGEMPLHLLAADVVFALLCGSIAWRYRKTIPWWRMGSIIMLAVLALMQRRQIGLAAFAIPALLLPEVTGRALSPGKRQNTPSHTWRQSALFVPVASIVITLLMCGMRCMGLLNMQGGLPRAGVDRQWFPFEAADYLKVNSPPDHLFHDLYTGSFLAYQLNGHPGVFIDGRLEIYGGKTWQDYFGPPDGRMSLDELFDKYKIQTALLDIRGVSTTPGHMARILASRSDWPIIYFDDHYAIFTKETSATEAFVKPRAFRIISPFGEQSLISSLTNSASAEAAITEAERATRQAPDSAIAHAALAMACLNTGRTDEGNRELEKAKAIDPTFSLAPGDSSKPQK